MPEPSVHDSRRRRVRGLAVLLALGVLLLLVWYGRAPSGAGEVVQHRGLAPSPGVSPTGATPQEEKAMEASPAESTQRAALRIWLHDPHWVWWTRRVPTQRYAELELPAAWQLEVGESATWAALQGRSWRDIEDAMADDELATRDLEHPAWATLSLLAKLEVARGSWHTSWLAAIDEVLPAGETWSSIGVEARDQHYREGRVPRGLDEEALRDELSLMRQRWPDEPYLRDVATVLEVALALEGAQSREERSGGEREELAVALLDTIDAEDLSEVTAEIIADRVGRPESLESVQQVLEHLPAGPYRRAHMQMWAIDAAVQRQDLPRMERWSRDLMEGMEHACAAADDHRADFACPRYQTAVDSVLARVAAFGGRAPASWRLALIGEAWRCCEELGGVGVLRTGTSAVEARWDGVGWQWGPWPDDPGIGDCLRRARPDPTPSRPVVVDVTVEVGR